MLALVIRHANRILPEPYYIVIRVRSGSAIFFHIIS